jgi:hypothetical protein
MRKASSAILTSLLATLLAIPLAGPAFPTSPPSHS